MNVIVIGGGKVGFYLCKTLLEHGHQPLIIEKNKRTCEYAANQLDIAVVNADGSTIEALTTANASPGRCSHRGHRSGPGQSDFLSAGKANLQGAENGGKGQ